MKRAFRAAHWHVVGAIPAPNGARVESSWSAIVTREQDEGLFLEIEFTQLRNQAADSIVHRFEQS